MKKLFCFVMALSLLCFSALAATDSRTGEDMSYIFGNGTGEVVQYGDVVYKVLGPDDEVFGVKIGDGRLPIVRAMEIMLPNMDVAVDDEGHPLVKYEYVGLLEAVGQEEMDRILSLPMDIEERSHTILVALGWYDYLKLEELDHDEYFGDEEDLQKFYFTEEDAWKIADGATQYMGAERPYKVLTVILHQDGQPDIYWRLGFAFESNDWWLCRMMYSMFPIVPTALL